jgi:hypothetical protein
VDGFEESGSSAGQYTCLVLTTGNVPDAELALHHATDGGGTWVYVESIRTIASADLAGEPCSYVAAVANRTNEIMSPPIALAVADGSPGGRPNAWMGPSGTRSCRGRPVRRPGDLPAGRAAAGGRRATIRATGVVRIAPRGV